MCQARSRKPLDTGQYEQLQRGIVECFAGAPCGVPESPPYFVGIYLPGSWEPEAPATYQSNNYGVRCLDVLSVGPNTQKEYGEIDSEIQWGANSKY